MKLQTLGLLTGIASLLLAGCGSTPKPSRNGGVVTAIQKPDGSFAAIDQDGNEVDTPEAQVLLGLLNGIGATQENLADDEIWATDASGNLTHIQSGGICPLEWREFSFSRSTIFKRDGSDVSCNFQNEELQASFTFYFYRNSQSVEDDLAGVMDAIKLRVPTSTAVQPNVFPLADSTYSIGMVEGTASNGLTRHDGALITKDSGWQIKLRVTYPAGRAFEMEPIAVTMLRAQLDQVNEDGFTPLRQDQPGDELKTES